MPQRHTTTVTSGYDATMSRKSHYRTSCYTPWGRLRRAAGGDAAPGHAPGDRFGGKSSRIDEAAVARYIADTFDGLDVVAASGDTFWFYEPGSTLPPDRRLPFATLVTGDRYDRDSRLSRPGVFRLNVGVGLDTYRALFGPPPAPPGAGGAVDTGHDFAVLDQLLPHPVYAPMSWVCLLSPSEATFRTVQPLLAEAHGLAVRRHARRAARG